MIVDAHAHAFEAIRGATRDGPTASGRDGTVIVGGRAIRALPASFKRTSFPVDSLLASLDGAGVDRAVLLQGPYYGEANAYVAEACRAHPDRLSGMAYLDPWSADAREALERIERSGAYRGVKLECSEPTGLVGLHPGRRLDEPGQAWLWDRLERSGRILTLDLGRPGTSSYQTDAVRSIAAAHPGLRVVICHLGQPAAGVFADRPLRRAWEEQLALGWMANVWFDLASLPAYYPGEAFPWPSAARALRLGLELVGSKKLLWGTDAPGLLVHGTYPQLLAWVREALARVPGADLDRVLGGNALAVYGG